MKDAKELVKEKYGKIAEQSNGDRSSCCGTSCCGDGSDRNGPRGLRTESSAGRNNSQLPALPLDGAGLERWRRLDHQVGQAHQGGQHVQHLLRHAGPPGRRLRRGRTGSSEGYRVPEVSRLIRTAQ